MRSLAARSLQIFLLVAQLGTGTLQAGSSALLLKTGSKPTSIRAAQRVQLQQLLGSASSDTVYGGGGCVFILYYFCSARADKTHLIEFTVLST